MATTKGLDMWHELDGAPVVGVDGVAEMWGVAAVTVRAMSSRGQMPEQVERGWWRLADVARWPREGRGTPVTAESIAQQAERARAVVAGASVVVVLPASWEARPDGGGVSQCIRWEWVRDHSQLWLRSPYGERAVLIPSRPEWIEALESGAPVRACGAADTDRLVQLPVLPADADEERDGPHPDDLDWGEWDEDAEDDAEVVWRSPSVAQGATSLSVEVLDDGRVQLVVWCGTATPARRRLAADEVDQMIAALRSVRGAQ